MRHLPKYPKMHLMDYLLTKKLSPRCCFAMLYQEPSLPRECSRMNLILQGELLRTELELRCSGPALLKCFHQQMERKMPESNTRVHGGALTVGKFIGLLKGGGGSGSGHLLLEVKSNIAELLLDVTDDLTLSSGCERVATLSEDLHQVVGEFTSSKVKTDDGMGKSITFIDGDSVGDTITRVHDDTSGTSRGIKGEDSLDGNIHGGHVEGLKHNLGHLLTVGLGVEGSLSKEDGLFLRGNTEFIVEGVVPDLLHIIPVGDDSMLNGVLEGKDTSLGLGLISNIGILLSHTDHHTLVAGTANNGGEDSSGSVISSETSFAHAGAIVNNKSGNVLVTHLCLRFKPFYYRS